MWVIISLTEEEEMMVAKNGLSAVADGLMNGVADDDLPPSADPIQKFYTAAGALMMLTGPIRLRTLPVDTMPLAARLSASVPEKAARASEWYERAYRLKQTESRPA
jgi:hypothetical protein